MRRFSIRNIFVVTICAALLSSALAARTDVAAGIFIIATSIFLFYVQVRQIRREIKVTLAGSDQSLCLLPSDEMPTSDPSEEMVSFFVRRTNQHIDRVRRCLALMASVTEHGVELNERGRIHDASKFGPAERIPYIWLTEYHRCSYEGVPFTYPDGMFDLVRAAINHHMTTNRHHAEFHADPNDMTEVDLIEMVCDWTAMSEEFCQDGGSARGWADKTIGKRLHFNADRAAFVYQTIDLLDSLRLTAIDHRF